MSERIPTGQLVAHHAGHDIGITSDDRYGVCADWETPVWFDGVEYSMGTPTAELVDLGPENATPDERGCGIGLGEQCCIYLVMGRAGFECQRFQGLRETLQEKNRKGEMSAKRQPAKMYPHCMLQDGNK